MPLDDATASQALQTNLRQLGIHAGDCVYLGIDLGGIAFPDWPLPKTREAMAQHRERCCRFVLDALEAVVGPHGTILAPAFSYDYARKGTPFVHESSPSEVGFFTEWFRQQAGVHRSFHPLFSVCGKGQHAVAILDGCGKQAFGPASPFGRLSSHHTKFLSLGVPLADWFTYAHHLEQLAGTHHSYHKLFNIPASRHGVEVPGPYLAFVRHLGAGVVASVDKLETALREAGVLVESRDVAGFLQVVSCADVDRIGLALLAHDPCAFITEPMEIHIDVPGAFRQPAHLAHTTRFVPG